MCLFNLNVPLLGLTGSPRGCKTTMWPCLLRTNQLLLSVTNGILSGDGDYSRKSGCSSPSLWGGQVVLVLPIRDSWVIKASGCHRAERFSLLQNFNYCIFYFVFFFPPNPLVPICFLRHHDRIWTDASKNPRCLVFPLNSTLLVVEKNNICSLTAEGDGGRGAAHFMMLH